MCITSLVVDSRTCNSITFVWAEPDTVSNYNISVCREDGTECMLYTCSCSKFTAEGLERGTRYTIKVDGVPNTATVGKSSTTQVKKNTFSCDLL